MASWGFWICWGFHRKCLDGGSIHARRYALPHEAALTSSLEPVGAMSVAIIVAAITFVGGFVVLGFITMKAGVFSKWAAALLIVGSIVTNLPPPRTRPC